VYDVKRAHKVGLELVAYIVLVLILTGANDTVPRTINNNINATKALNCALNDSIHRFTSANVAQRAETVLMDILHVLKAGLKHATNRRHQISMRKRAFNERMAHLACTSKDLFMVSVLHK
jgi:TRAP-type mannitol/chloroaromatic compound transport system permease small subunit